MPQRRRRAKRQARMHNLFDSHSCDNHVNTFAKFKKIIYHEGHEVFLNQLGCDVILVVHLEFGNYLFLFGLFMLFMVYSVFGEGIV